jgi:hypothetical protein
MTCPTPVHSTMTSGSKPASAIVDLQAQLLSDEGREEADRTRAGHEHGPRLPEGAPADREDVLPGLDDDGRGLEQHTQEAERAVDLDGVLGLDPPEPGHEAVDLLDAALGVLAVAAHVPLSDGAVGAGHGVGAPDDAGHEISLPERAARARVHDPAERFVPEHEARLARRRPAVLALGDFDVGSAYADRDRFHEHRPASRFGIRNVFQEGGSRLAWFDGNGLHLGVILPCWRPSPASGQRTGRCSP